MNLIKSLILSFLISSFLFLVSIFVSSASASEYKFIDVDELKINYKDYFPGGADPLITQNGIPNRQLGKQVNLNLNLDLMNVLYWNNTVHGTTDEIIGSNKGQFRRVGWQFQFGINIEEHISVEYYHHSQHLLDYEWPYGRWPVEDAISVNLYIIRKHKKDTIF